jgi:hypothetical protein
METNIVEIFTQASVIIAFLVGVDIALVQGIKKFVINNTRYAFVISILVGIALAWFFLPFATAVRVLIGVIIGLTASGVYGGVKATVGK